MKGKDKQCSFCPYFGPLWKSEPKTCPSCARKQAAQQSIERSSGQYNHKGLVATESGGVAKVFRLIRPVSKNLQSPLAKYRRLRDKYFIDHPVCEYPGCGSRKITLHHKRGRLGAFLTDKRYFCSLCHEHHRWVELNSVEAKKMGLSDSRLEKGVLIQKSA